MKSITLFSILRSVFAVRASFRAGEVQGAARVKTELEQYGVLGLKLGQILATRFDIVPASVRKELASFYEEIEPVSFELIKAELDRELGTKHKYTVDHAPLAVGSIAQVHTGIYREQEVVYKIVKPQSQKEVQGGIRSLKRLRLFMRVLPVLKRYISFVDQLVSLVGGELNMLQEASTMESVRKACPSVVIPEVVWDLTTRSVLTTSKLEGVSAHKIDPKWHTSVANQLLDAFFEQVFQLGVYHADMHHGNIRVHEGRVQLLDFGMVGYLSAEERYHLAVLCLGFMLQDERLVADGVLGLCPTRIKNPYKFRSDLFRCMMKYTVYKLGRIDFESSLTDLLGVLAEHKVSINPSLTALVKTLVTLQGVVSSMDADISMVGMIEARKHILLRATLRYKGIGWLRNALNV